MSEAREARVVELEKLWAKFPTRDRMEQAAKDAEIERYEKALDDMPPDEVMIAIENHMNGPNARKFPTSWEIREEFEKRRAQLRATSGAKVEDVCRTCNDQGQVAIPMKRKQGGQFPRGGKMEADVRMVDVDDMVGCPHCAAGRKFNATVFGGDWWEGKEPAEYLGDPVPERVLPQAANAHLAKCLIAMQAGKITQEEMREEVDAAVAAAGHEPLTWV